MKIMVFHNANLKKQKLSHLFNGRLSHGPQFTHKMERPPAEGKDYEKLLKM